jgi:hypothetical protein
VAAAPNTIKRTRKSPNSDKAPVAVKKAKLASSGDDKDAHVLDDSEEESEYDPSESGSDSSDSDSSNSDSSDSEISD